jgi:RES domain-containing protein
MKPIIDHPRYKQLRFEIRAAVDGLCRPWEGLLYRCVELEWAKPENILSGEGARTHGSRWMRPGLHRLVYGASTELIALKETRRGLSYYGIKKPRQNPRVTVEIVASFSKVIFLADLVSAVSWLQMDELLEEDWRKVNQAGNETLSQACGRALIASGCECLAAPSVKDGRGRNFVWFPENLGELCKVDISGRKELEQWLAK